MVLWSFKIKGNFDDGLDIVKEIAEVEPITIVNSVNPYRLQGQKTASFEIIDNLGEAPDYHCLPVGNAGNITSYWLGYREYHQMAKSSQLPKMLGYQASESAPLVHQQRVMQPDTLATAIRIGNPQYWQGATDATQESAGWFKAIEDKDILAAQYLLASEEGIFCEPASAASIAGLISDYQEGRITAGSRIVCTLTGNGLKDPDIIQHHTINPMQTVASELAAVQEVIMKEMS